MNNNIINPNIPNKEYVELLELIKGIEIESSILSLPLTREEYSVVGGEYGGAYIGPTVIGFVTGKRDYAGIQSFF